MRQREKKSFHPSFHPRSFHPLLHAPDPGAAAMLIGEQEERGGAGSTDQGSVAISQCIDQ